MTGINYRDDPDQLSAHTFAKRFYEVQFHEAALRTPEGAMQDTAVEILATHQTMAISTLRPDGWPQTTIVTYASEGLTLYFLVFRKSQKLANIRRDKRISIAVGGEQRELDRLTAVYAAAHASELADPKERERVWGLLQSRHPNLADFELPDRTQAAMIKAKCQFVSILDYRKGAGHIDELSIGEQGATGEHPRTDEWGRATVRPAMLRPKKMPA
jgi:nitroimidazol reductase NimA-like FMN-containing flavoprotein (pyridoxamine 5'-phosphate oxidase superfamily)